MSLSAGTSVDRYVLLEPLGEGGQGAVWKARDPLAPEVPCALKLIRTLGASPTDLERARREARALAALEHPALVKCRGLFEDLKLGVLGIAMELVEGRSARELLEDPRFGTPERQQLLTHVAHALAHLHQNGIVHRDVKLENVLVRDAFWREPSALGSIKLVDLGIAVVRGADAQLTALGTIVGTLPYLAPEQLDPATFGDVPVAPTLDVFAFGVMGWLLLRGEHPTLLSSSARLSDFTRAYRAALEPGATWPPAGPATAFTAVLERALAVLPESRPRDGAALVEALGEPSSVVVRPLGGGAGAETSVATPRAMHQRTEEQVVGQPARAATAAITPGAAARESREREAPRAGFAWIVVGTFAAVAAIVVLVVRPHLGHDATPPRPTRSALPPSTAPITPRAKPTAEPDAATDAPEDVAMAEAAAAPAHCAHGCLSGRDCGEEGCDGTIDPTEDFKLRLGAATRDAQGQSLFGLYQTAEVCLSIGGDAGPRVCTPLASVEDGGVPDTALYATVLDLTGRGLDVSIQNVVPGVGSAPLAQTLLRLDGVPRRALCDGLAVESFDGLPEVKVRLFLDAAGTSSPPERCPPQR